MATERVNPSASSVVSGGVTNHANAVDGDVSTAATLATVFGTPARLQAATFGNAAEVSDGGRTAAVLEIMGIWDTQAVTDGDELEVFVGIDPLPVASVGTITASQGDVVQVMTLDITGDLLDDPEADLVVELEAKKTADAADGELTIARLQLRLEGGEAPPTLAEIGEDIDAVALQRFEASYNTAKATLESAFDAFGCTDDPERLALTQAVLDGLTATEAAVSLTRRYGEDQTETLRDARTKINPTMQDAGAP